MSEIHIYQCDHCGKRVEESRYPIGWGKAVPVKDGTVVVVPNYWNDVNIDICDKCGPEIKKKPHVFVTFTDPWKTDISVEGE